MSEAKDSCGGKCLKKYKYQKVLQADPIVEMLLNPVPKYMLDSETG